MATEQEAFEEVMSKLSPKQRVTASIYRKWLLSDKAPSWWKECLAPISGRRNSAMYGAFILSRLELDLALGVLAVARVEIGDVPAPDKERERNEQVLAKALPSGWRVNVKGGYNDDGCVVWGDRRPGFVDLMEMRKPYFRSWAPLEIGSTRVHKTLFHLQREGALARWPYGSKYLWIFERRQRHPLEQVREWGELVERRRALSLPKPAIVCIDEHFRGLLDLQACRPPLAP